MRCRIISIVGYHLCKNLQKEKFYNRYTQFIPPRDVQNIGSGGHLHTEGVKNWREYIHITFRILWCLVHFILCVCVCVSYSEQMIEYMTRKEAREGGREREGRRKDSFTLIKALAAFRQAS